MPLIEIHLHFNEKKQDLILGGQKQIISLINQNQKIIMADLSTLTQQVADNNSVIESAITLLGNIKAALDAAGTDPAKLKELSDSLAAEDSKLADAIVANTPAA